MNVLSLFSGIGGLELGLERAGMRVVGQVEIDPFCRQVLAKHWPEVPRHDDVRTAVEWWESESRPAVHVVAGGFPCQPVSLAGPGRAQEDDRWLWPEMADVIAAIQPRWVVGENVPGLRTRGLDVVLDDLRRLGYATRAGYISACEVGAPHPRRRLFVLAHTVRGGCDEGSATPRRGGKRAPRAQGEAGGLPQAAGSTWWTAEPDVARGANGGSAGVDRRRALGNAVVPQVAEHIGRLIVAADTAGVAS